MNRRRVINRLAPKEFDNFKLQAFCVFVGCAFVLQLWFAFRGHVSLNDGLVSWHEVVSTQTRIPRSFDGRKRRSEGNLVRRKHDEFSKIAEDIKKSLRKINNITQTSQTIPKKRNGRLFSMKWDHVCCESINCLRTYPLFPRFPSDTRFLRSLRVVTSGKLYGQRIAGRLAPPECGLYRFLVKCDGTCELWLGENELPTSAKLLGKVVRGIPINISQEILDLSSRKQYFIDILFSVHREVDRPLEVSWKRPNSEKFIVITNFGDFPPMTSSRDILRDFSWSPAVRVTPFLESIEETGEDDEEFKTIGKDNPHSDRFVEFHGKMVPVNRSLYGADTADIKKLNPASLLLSNCDYKPSYVAKRALPKYSGVWRTLFSSVFPGDNTGYMRCIGNRYPHDCKGNERIPRETMQKFVSLFSRVLEEHNARSAHKNSGGQMEVINVKNIEEKKDPVKGSRFFFEATLTDSSSKSTFSYLSYLYMNREGTSLCIPKGFVVDTTTTVHVVIVVKNQTRWLRHFLDNMEKIYDDTNEVALKIIIAYYGREDLKLMKEYRDNRLPNIRMIRQFGKFRKSKAIQSAVDTIHDPNSIIFLMDLHVIIPETMIELVRKHTVQGKMVFNPVLFRLAYCASPASFSKAALGFWETFGYGILGIFKSDWDRIGGMRSKKYNRGWGGEDWELLDRIIAAGLEVERLRVADFYHFYHSKQNMWE